MAKYSKLWAHEAPGYLIFLLDQSGSMKEPYPQFGNKAAFAARVINRTIYEVILASKSKEEVRNRAFISIIGYGNPGVNEIKSGFLKDFYENPLRIESGKQAVPDGNGGIIEMDVKNYVWIEPAFNGTTPMGSAFKYARNLVNEWINAKPNNPAPVIINVSDGMLYDGSSNNNEDDAEVKSAIKMASEIMALSCDDGNPLIFNAHIGIGSPKFSFPELKNELSDEQAQFLFDISSKVPETYQSSPEGQKLGVKKNASGFVSNAEPETFVRFIQFSSLPSKDKGSVSNDSEDGW